MQAYWIEFEDGDTGCCDGLSEHDARMIAEHFKMKKVKSLSRLPYPASPIIWQFTHPVAGRTPAFCFMPERCKGKGSCPRDPSCTS